MALREYIEVQILGIHFPVLREGKIFAGGGKRTAPFGRSGVGQLGRETPTDCDKFDIADHQ